MTFPMKLGRIWIVDPHALKFLQRDERGYTASIIGIQDPVLVDQEIARLLIKQKTLVQCRQAEINSDQCWFNPLAVTTLTETAHMSQTLGFLDGSILLISGRLGSYVMQNIQSARSRT